MGLKFSSGGPEFPEALIEDLLLGEVVFLCGAGVSAPQLPNFATLVDNLYSWLSIDKDTAEKKAVDAGRYEEAIGTLARRLAKPTQIYDGVSHILAIPSRPKLQRHQAILRLSRRADNRPVLITTNFDTMFERAAELLNHNDQRTAPSVAGQALPAPGGQDFTGIIHLHGRLEDRKLGLERTNLVLTSAEYGEAYMRSGWAARFLFDLARCRSIVLVGYSAGDAPVRYLLNVLESDRDRFVDLKPVYALVGSKIDREQDESLWSALAVKPLVYKIDLSGGNEDHSALWNDLQKVAALVEKPKDVRRTKCMHILRLPFDKASSNEQATVEWSLKGRRDLIDATIASIKDSRWWDFIVGHRLWSEKETAWACSNWCAKAWTKLPRLEAAISWSSKLGPDFGEHIEFWLRRAAEANQPAPPKHWKKAWRLLALSGRERARSSQDAYALQRIIAAGDALDADYQAAINMLEPRITITKRWRFDDSKKKETKRLDDLVSISFEIRHDDLWPGINQALLANVAHLPRAALLATETMRSALETARDAEQISDSWDRVDLDVPAVEEHPQNEYHAGFLPIARLLVDSLPLLVQHDRSFARSLVNQWREIDARLSKRLCLHALRNAEAFSSDDAIDYLNSLGAEDFWSIRREWVQLASERLREAEPAKISQLIDRIVSEGPKLYRNLRRRAHDGADWRPYARAQAMWLRLSAIHRAGVLNGSGQDSLSSIKREHPYLNRDYQEQDLFRIWSSGVRSVGGNAAPLIEAKPNERLEIAQQLSTSFEPEAQQGWSAYCGADPQGALQSLLGNPPLSKDAELWRQFLNIIAIQPSAHDDMVRRKAMIKAALHHLEIAKKPFLRSVVHSLVDALNYAHQHKVRAHVEWWERLWEIASKLPLEIKDGENGFYSKLINSPAGRLVEGLLKKIEVDRKDKKKVLKRDLKRLSLVFRSNAASAQLGRGACVRDLGFLWSVDATLVREELFPHLRGNSLESIRLRAVFAEYANINHATSNALKSVIFRSIEESKTTSLPASNVAAKALLPVLWSMRDPNGPCSDITAIDVRRILAKSTDGVREGAAYCYRTWISQLGPDRAAAWRNTIGPLFENTWPLERKFKRDALIDDFVSLCVSTADAFPQAFEVVKPYLANATRDWVNIHSLENSDVVSRFPYECLELLWIILGPPSKSNSHYLGAILEKIAAADPALTVDRRYQWLGERAARF